MKAILLNAGMGQRLGRKMPKCLNYVNPNERIIDRQLELLKQINIPVYCVVGFKKEIIMEEYPNLNYVYNEKYHNTNTSKSLLKALDTINQNGDILWLNGDVYLPLDFSIQEFVAFEGNVILCNEDHHCADEEVKYSLDSQGRISAISKEVTTFQGESLGVNLIRSEFLEDFKLALEQCEPNDYFEKACEILISKGILFKPFLTSTNVREIDTYEDLQAIYETKHASTL